MDTQMIVTITVFVLAFVIALCTQSIRIYKARHPRPSAQLKDPEAWQRNVDTKWHD